MTKRQGKRTSRMTMTGGEHVKVSAARFYSEYHGHRVEHLEALLPELRKSADSLIWTAGDSSLDNKYWYDPDCI